MLVFAVEENDGDGVAALYAAFERAGQLLVYDAVDSVPNPLALEEWAKGGCSAPVARPIEALLDGQALETLAGGDQFIAGCAFSIAAHECGDEAWRLPLLGRDERNDWTLLARMRID